MEIYFVSNLKKDMKLVNRKQQAVYSLDKDALELTHDNKISFLEKKKTAFKYYFIKMMVKNKTC